MCRAFGVHFFGPPCRCRLYGGDRPTAKKSWGRCPQVAPPDLLAGFKSGGRDRGRRKGKDRRVGQLSDEDRRRREGAEGDWIGLSRV